MLRLRSVLATVGPRALVPRAGASASSVAKPAAENKKAPAKNKNAPAKKAQFKGKEKEVYDATLTVLKAAAAGDWKTYAKVCDESITCFEPEAMGCVATGLDFHKFYFTLPSSGDSSTPPNTTLVDVNIRMLGGKAASICYTRLVQRMGAAGPETVKSNESRVFLDVKDGGWKCVHFHRSPAA